MKNNFFYQDRETLAEKRHLLILVMQDKGISDSEQNYILEVYKAFCDYKNIYRFDGATIVADFDTIKDLDVSAMCHDYEYIIAQHKGILFYLKAKLKADIDFGLRMRSLGVTWLNAWSRVFSLILSTPFWMGYLILKGKL